MPIIIIAVYNGCGKPFLGIRHQGAGCGKGYIPSHGMDFFENFGFETQVLCASKR